MPRVQWFQAWQPWIVSISVAICFFLAARLSLALLDKSDGVAVFWPAAGVATGVLVALGPIARWPVVIGVVAATFAANLLGDRNFASTAVFAVANASGPLIVSALIQRFYGAPFELDELRRVFGLFAATILAALMSGLVGTLGFVLFHPSDCVRRDDVESLGLFRDRGEHHRRAAVDRSCFVPAQCPAEGVKLRKGPSRLRSWPRCVGSLLSCPMSPGHSNWRLPRSVRCSCG